MSDNLILSDGTFSYLIISNDRLAEVLNFMETAYYPDDGICNASNVPKNPNAVQEINQLCAAHLKDGVSVIGVENQSNKIVGVAINQLQEKRTLGEESFVEKFSRNECHEKESLTVLNIKISCDSVLDVFQTLKVDKIIEIVFLSVLPEYRTSPVGVTLVEVTLQLLERLAKEENGPKAVTALLSAAYSQDIVKSLDFQILSTISFGTFSCDGVKFSDKLSSEYKTVKICAKKYQPKDL